MIVHNRDFTARIKVRLMEKDPELYKDITESQVLTEVNFFTRNISYAVFRHKHISVHKLFNIFPNANKIFEYRLSCIKQKSVAKLNKYFYEIREEWKNKQQKT
jgi:hypothetical protein